MLRRLVIGVALLPALLDAGAAAAPPSWPRCPPPQVWAVSELRQKLLVKVCGEQRVIPGVDYPYTVQVTNVDKRSYRGVTLTLSHYDPLTRASRPYRRGDRAIPPWEAVWTLERLRPGQTFRVGIRLPFLRHNDPKGSNFTVGVGTRLAKNVGNLTKDVYFIR
jgi:hypothetical protein